MLLLHVYNFEALNIANSYRLVNIQINLVYFCILFFKNIKICNIDFFGKFCFSFFPYFVFCFSFF